MKKWHTLVSEAMKDASRKYKKQGGAGVRKTKTKKTKRRTTRRTRK